MEENTPTPQWPNIIGGVGAHIRIHGRVAGLETGLHGFHVHAVGNTSENCLAAGGHFNPDQVGIKSPSFLSCDQTKIRQTLDFHCLC